MMIWSKLKPAEKFRTMWEQHGYDFSDLRVEYKFAKDRMWRFDFAWPSCKLAVEIHGFGYGHQAQQNLAADCEKMRGAIQRGWVVVPYTTRCISSRAKCQAAVEDICLLISRLHAERRDTSIPFLGEVS